MSTAVAAEEAIIRYESVGKAFWTHGKQVVALDGVSLTVQRNEFTSVVGPSGCGKTTLLRLCSGLEPTTSGLTLYRGTPVAGINSDVGYITQDSNLYPWMTVRENVEFPLELRDIPPDERRARSEAYIRMVGLQGFEEHYPYQLSGGMQKRASIIRTMIYDPEVILMDEPFGALDAQTRMVLQGDLLHIWSQRQKTILFITHDLTEAIALSDNVVVMSARPGTIKRVFEVPLSRPRDVFQIHSQPGFAETYSQIWEYFQPEVEHSQVGGVSAQRVELPPPLASLSRNGHSAPADGRPHPSPLPVLRGRRERRERGSMSTLQINVARLVTGLAILGLWQGLAEAKILNPLLFSTPVKVIGRLATFLGGEVVYSRTIYNHLSVTLEEMAVGYAVGAVLGMAVGFALARSRPLSRIFEPYILAIYSVPKIALAPLFVLTLGIGITSKWGVVTMEVFFLVFFNTFSGVRNINEEFVQLALVMGARKAQVTRRIILPASLPFIMTGLKMGIPFAMIGAIIGEFIASNQGLGWLILYMASNFDASGLFAAILILVAVVWLLGQLLALVEARTLRWQPVRQDASVQI
ncbi:MAG: ATP-binding cassette domain-containing protein [Chloroflexota bacterium]